MENSGQMNPQELRIQGLLDLYLASRKAGETAVQTPHLDEDSLAAFAEGTLSEREAKPVVSHLVDCGFCRHITAELVRLDLQFAFETETVRPVAEAAEPAKISQVLSNLLSRIFGTNDSAVFAHEEKDEEKETEKDSAEDDEKR